jgi:hypothetical protein
MKNLRHALSFIVSPLIALATLSACGSDDRILVGEILDELRDGSNPAPTATMEPAPTATMVPTSMPEYDTSNAQDILFVYCSSCHNPMLEVGFIASVDIDDLIVAGLIAPGNANESPVFVRMLREEMPPAGVEPRPSASEIDTVGDFIDSL